MPFTERYVIPGGAGGKTGGDLANAYAWADMVTAINVTGDRAGFRYNLYGNFTSVPNTAFATGGTAGFPMVLRGCGSIDGDGWQGRKANGQLDTTNYFGADFATNAGLTLSGNYIVLESANLTGNSTAEILTLSGASVARGIRGVNAATTSAGHVFNVAHGNAMLTSFDAFQTGASGGASALRMSGGQASDFLLNSVSGNGITHASSAPNAANGVIYGCGGDGINSTTTGASAYLTFSHLTIQGCAGDAVNIAAGNVAGIHLIGCSLTDNGGYGVDANGAAVMVDLHKTRVRDNALGNFNIDAEWLDCATGTITTDAGGPETDYEDYAAGDFRPVRASVLRDDSGLGFNIGGCANKYPVAGGGGGGGGRRRVVIIPVR